MRVVISRCGREIQPQRPHPEVPAPAGLEGSPGGLHKKPKRDLWNDPSRLFGYAEKHLRMRGARTPAFQDQGNFRVRVGDPAAAASP
jgi:hypothetical protein